MALLQDTGTLAASIGLVLRLPLLIGLESVDAAPPGLERDLAARAEALLLDERDHRRARIARPGVEHREEALGDEVEHTPLVGRERLEVLSMSVGMTAWWSLTFASLTTRPSGSWSSASTYSAPLR